MKKTYEKPVLTTEAFDVEDVITASSAIQNLLHQVGDQFESLFENITDMFGNLNP